MSDALAYLLTWTCYGTWLHGDQRGSVGQDSNVPDTPFLPPNKPHEQFDVGHLRREPIELDAASRDLVQRTIAAHCAHRKWDLLAVHVRTNHIHVVVVACGSLAPEAVMGQFKSWCTRRLREAGLAPDQGPVWTKHVSTRYLWKPASVEAAVRYVVEGQGADLK